MGIAAGMKDIVQDIVSSRDARVSEVKGLKEEANEMLGSFKASHEKMGVQLRKDLTRDKASRKSDVKKMLKGFQASRWKEGAQLRKELAQGLAEQMSEGSKLREELAQSHASRKSGVAELLKSAQDLVTDLGKSRQETGEKLRKDLAEHTQAVRGDVARLRQEIGASHQDMSAKLRKNLARGSAARKSEVHVMFNDFERAHNQMGRQLRKELADNDRGIKSEVAGMRQETKADLGEARTAWQGVTRGVKKAVVKATPRVVRAEVEKAALKQEETPDLEAKLLAAIREHPEGITLTEVAESLGVAPIVFGRVSRKLLGEGKIRKADKAYFLAPAD